MAKQFVRRELLVATANTNSPEQWQTLGSKRGDVMGESEDELFVANLKCLDLHYDAEVVETMRATEGPVLQGTPIPYLIQ